MNSDSEQQLAEALARFLDHRIPAPADLHAEMETLAHIDSLLDDPGAGAPASLSGHPILSKIGSGGMGVVYLARDERLGRDVAIKTLSPRYAHSPELTARFLREARTMAQMAHPNIARIYSLGAPGEPPHFVMELLKGAPLTTASAKLSFHQKAELMDKVVLAVAFLHEHGVLHRDLKPDNVLVDLDLEPKLLDFGLSIDAADPFRLSQPGDIAGTPHYLSPEQTRGANIDQRSDVFALGVLLYELLTGHVPFEGSTASELIERIRTQEPIVPARRNAAIPRDLQNICLKALEKDPRHRYLSARAMAEDLERFLAGESVLADPEAYSRLMSAQIAQHLNDLEGWRADGIISPAEHDALRGRYDRLIDREDAWIMDARRLTLPQVSLYLGAWILTTAAALLTIFRYPGLGPAPASAMALSSVAPAAWFGIDAWKRGRFRVALAFLLGVTLLLPLAAAVLLNEFGYASTLTQGRKDLELFDALDLSRQTTNAQIWWALLAGLPACLWLRRFTRASVFTLAAASLTALLCLATLLRLGLLEWLDKDPGRVYLHLLPFAVLFLAAGFLLESRRKFDDSRYVYPFAVVFTWAALTGLAAFHEPYAHWLRAAAPWTRGQHEYLFLLNAGIYLALDQICERLATPQLRAVGKAFRFVLPGHILTSLLLLGLHAEDAKRASEASLFEWLLPIAACAFVFGSIPRQMKNFFASGLLFLAIGIVRLQRHTFRDQALWPLLLLAAGLGLMLAAAHYAPLRLALRRFLRFEKKSRA